MPNRPDWDTYWLGVAEAVAARSTCRRRQVGAVAVSATNSVRGTGYNGAPPGEPHCIDGACPRGRLTYEQEPSYADRPDGKVTNCTAIHAEMNAIAGVGLDVATVYVTCRPCADCAAVLRAIDIRIVWPGKEHRHAAFAG